MYVYFDSNGILKEIITEKNFRTGDSKRDKIYVYVEDNFNPYTGWIKYRLPDGNYTAETKFYDLYAEKIGKELPIKPIRNLKYFSYDHTYEKDGVIHSGYEFYEITVPDEVLNSSNTDDKEPLANNLVVARIRFVMSERLNNLPQDDDEISTLGAIPFTVETNIGIITDSSINESQYNYLIKLIGENTGVFFTPQISDDGVLSWINNGNKPNPTPINVIGPVGPQGPQGIQGPQGPQGIQGPAGESVINATYFKIDDSGHLIMYYSSENKPDIYLVSDDENSESYYETLGVPANLVGHLVFIYS